MIEKQQIERIMKRRVADCNSSEVDVSGKGNGIKKSNIVPSPTKSEIELKPNVQLPTLLPKPRSSRNIKPNSLIFTKDVEVNMPRKRNIVKKKASRLASNALNKFKSTGYNLKKNLISNAATKLTANKLKTTKRKYKKRDKILDDQSSLTTSSTDELEDNISNDNENFKNSINLNSSKLTHLFNKQPLTKNGKLKGRPRKPVVIDSILDCLKDVSVAGYDSKNFKSLLEKIDESHKNQMMQLRKELDDKDKEKVLLDAKNAKLTEEIEMLRGRLTDLNNESELQKEIQRIKKLHCEEISDIKKKLWCSNSGCEKQAIYFCCFNAFYCSLNCQNEHWYSIHKKSCKNRNRSEHKTNKKMNTVKHHVKHS